MGPSGRRVIYQGLLPGQEIIARLHYRGQVKRRLCHATTENKTVWNPVPR